MATLPSSPLSGLLVHDTSDQLEMTSMRIHELALQKFLYKNFLVEKGYPVPVVFATPRDAQSEFSKLWQADKNPFAYLEKLAGPDGQPLYSKVAYPTNLVYPLISIKRLNWRVRPAQSYGIFRNRHQYYPTVDTDVDKNALAYAAVNWQPTGWDFRFQIDHYCNRPETQSKFVNRVQRAFSLTASIPQTFIPVYYPFPHGVQPIRIYIEGDIDNISVEEDDQNAQENRTSITVAIEGFSVDYTTILNPVLWKTSFATEKTTLSPDELDLFSVPDLVNRVDDVRIGYTNPVIKSNSNLPPDADKI